MKKTARTLAYQPVGVARSRLPEPVVTYLVAARMWRLERSYSCTHRQHRLTVPRHFTFDLASVPRVFWWIIAPFELSISAPLIHDFLYRHRGHPPTGSVMPPRTYSRRESDRVFRDLMKEEGVSALRRTAAYVAVRLFGWIPWHAERREGEHMPDPALVVSVFSAALQAIQTWISARDQGETAETLKRSFDLSRTSPELQREATVLADLLPDDVMTTLEARVMRCWNSLNDVLGAPGDYLPNEVDEAMEAFERCLCRELGRIYRLNGSIPPGKLEEWWNRFCQAA